MENVAQENEKAISGAIRIDEKEIRTHLDGLVRQSVEDTLNALLNAEADAICQASRYQRSPDRQDTRAGNYKRKLLTKAGGSGTSRSPPENAAVRQRCIMHWYRNAFHHVSVETSSRSCGDA